MSYQQVSKVESNKKVVILNSFRSVLIQIGTITPQEDYTPILEPYRAPKHLLETEQEQGLYSEKKSNILNHNQRAQLDIGF